MPATTRRRLPTWALAGALLGGLATTTTPATAKAAPDLCTSTRDPALATRLSEDIRTALKGRDSTVSIAVHDPKRGLRCGLADARHYDSASIAKVLITEAVLGRAEELGREPTRQESRRLKAMITRSDNEAAGELWSGLSRDRMNRVLREAGATDTVLGHDRYWGLTSTTARDQLALLAAVSRRPAALTLMGQVIRSQAWGVTAGAPRGAKVHLKNGWLPRATHGWRVHSIGIVRGTGLDYRLALLSHDNETMRYGVRTLEGVALAVHRRLGGGAAADRGFTPAEGISEIPDGSAPEHDPTRPTHPQGLPDRPDRLPDRHPGLPHHPAPASPPHTAPDRPQAPPPLRSRASG